MGCEKGLAGRWVFKTDASNSCGRHIKARSKAVVFGEKGPGEKMPAARFDGNSSVIEIEACPELRTGKNGFTLSAWIHAASSTEGGDVAGDILSSFDPGTRRGFNLSVVTNGSVTSTTQANYRHIHFGIDQGRSSNFEDCGRPGEAVFIKALASIEGQLYAGTFEIEREETGHLYRYAGESNWEDLGAPPDKSNSISSVARFDGALHVASGMYLPTGSWLGPPRNTHPGGHVYRIDGDGRWIDCGRPGKEYSAADTVPIGAGNGKADAASALTLYRGNLYCTSGNQRGVFVYEGEQNWRRIGPDSRIISLAVYRDSLYALANRGISPEHGGALYRYEGKSSWEFCGRPGKATQIYGAAICAGSLYAGTWPDCEVQRYDGDKGWENLGRLGYEMEVMAMALYNGTIYAGSLPMANIWRYDGSAGFNFIGNVDNSEVRLRRAWSMAVHGGALHVGTLPSGRVKRYRAGVMATSDSSLPAGWHHVAAVRGDSTLKLYLDGRSIAESEPFEAGDYDLDTGLPLKIGFGQHEHFRGLMADLRIYKESLPPEQVERLAGEVKKR